MLDQVDGLIRSVLLRDVTDLTTADQVRFQPPDDDWHTAVANLGRTALNVYLVDIRENPALRDTEWLVSFEADGPHREVGPARMDCHYLISAWSPASVTPALEPTLAEHALLYRAMAALLRADPLNAEQIYPPGSAALAATDPLIRAADLPVRVAPGEGWPKLAEFWGAMGSNERWKPAIWYTVTIPVSFARQVAGPLVTTRIIEFRSGTEAAGADRWVQIGGTVTDSGGLAVDGAIVSITDGGGIIGTATSGADGRFTIAALHSGDFQLNATKPGTGSASSAAALPSPTGNYDLTLT
jgi:hypothetical protein